MAILAECPVCHRKQKNTNKNCPGCGSDLDAAKRSNRVRYWVSARDADGRQVRRAVGSFADLKAHSITDAKKAEAKITVQKKEGKPLFNQRPGAEMTFDGLISWYRKLPQVRKLASYPRLNSVFGHFSDHYGGHLVNELKHSELVAYQSLRDDDGAAPRTIDHELSVIKTMCSQAFYDDLIDGHILKAFKPIRKKCRFGSNARRRAMRPDEYLRLLAVAPPVFKGILTLGWYTGMRLGEILGLRRSHIDRAAGFIRLPAGSTKEAKAKSVPVNHHVQAVLTAAAGAKIIHQDFVFTIAGQPIDQNAFQYYFRKICAAAGVVHGRKTAGGTIFHDIRRTVKSSMLEAGVQKAYRDTILGHSLRGMDAHYLVITDERLTDAMKRYTDYMDRLLSDVDQSVDHEGQAEPFVWRKGSA